ncbi:DNA/RNA non-specific endonuclease [Solibacillus kalamii]|uniref:DNA/RNA non-specific endonuclease n=2 Tax=Solibacillus kalamii TaxID=1748298 RepID=UPI0030B85819
MMTEGVTDVNFPAEQWQSFASQNPLMIALAYRTQSLDQVINMNPLFNPGGIGGANPYTLSGLYLTGQQPLGTFGLSGAMVSTNFVSFMKQKEKEKEIAKELSATATTVDNVKEEGNGFLNFLGDVGSGATKVGKGLLDFLLLDDVSTLADKNASGLDKGIALASFIPIGKVLKIPKAIDKIVDSNVDEVVKKSDVDEVVGKGTGNTSNIVNFGEQYTKVNGKKALKPNIEYKTKEGYHYKTDSEGRISNVEATLQLGKADRNNYAQRTVGREDRLPNDDGGHLIASIFKGSGEIDNLVPMNATLNRKEYKALETSWKKALESGKTVEVKIEPIYKVNSSRPSKFEVEYKINGKKYEVNLSNYNGGS